MSKALESIMLSDCYKQYVDNSTQFFLRILKKIQGSEFIDMKSLELSAISLFNSVRFTTIFTNVYNNRLHKGGIDTMTIVSVKRVNTEGGENGSLVLNINYDNKRSNLIMFSVRFNRINFWGTIQGGGYSSTLDTNDIESTVYFGLKKDDKGTLRLKISNTQYYLTDAYNLKFDRK